MGIKSAHRLRLLSLALWLAPGEVWSADPTPVKLDVEARAHSLHQGEPLQIQVSLLDAANQPAKAPKRLSLLLQARSAAGKVEKIQEVEIAAGQSSKQLAITPPGSGLVYIWAKNPELLPGGAYVAIRPAAAPSRPAVPPRAAAPSRTTVPSRAGAPFPAAAPFPTAAPVPAAAPVPQAIRSAPMPEIALRFSPDRQFLADGKDAVTVQAFLLGGDDAARSDFRLNIFDSSGTMQPAPLIIPKGQASGRSVLTSSHPGNITVEFLGSTPPSECEGDRKLSIKFRPPITRVGFKASPPRISLVDTSDVILELTDELGRPINDDAPRVVTFAIDSGRGTLGSKEVHIPAGQFWARANFQPEWPGLVSVSASTPNLLTATTTLDVSTPVALLLCSALGGLTGGVFSYLKSRGKSGQRRILIGLVTGFIFYWACIFLGLASVGHGVVLNPLSAFSLSTLGGWLQTEVLTVVWGIVRPRAQA